MKKGLNENMNVAAEMLKLGVRLAGAAAEAQIELSKTALEDCNKFCKFDTGELCASSYKASNLLLGKLVWRTNYARHAYYLGEADRSKNPLASRLWAHKAAAVFGDKWLEITRRRFLQRAVFGFRKEEIK
ncbi:MAG: minor capsid protein [Oscillospiraceae bacterium]|nr:minor capsid protein [Oscillospiraceae bacterium]